MKSSLFSSPLLTSVSVLLVLLPGAVGAADWSLSPILWGVGGRRAIWLQSVALRPSSSSSLGNEAAGGEKRRRGDRGIGALSRVSLSRSAFRRRRLLHRLRR